MAWLPCGGEKPAAGVTPVGTGAYTVKSVMKRTLWLAEVPLKVGEISINFDGWCFLRFPMTDKSPVRAISPGGVNGQWVAGKGKTKGVVYPIKLTGVAVEMTRKALDLTEMAPVSPVIRVKDLAAF